MDTENTNSKFLLSGKTAVLTGGCGHLGRSMTMALADAEAATIVCDIDINKFHGAFGDTKPDNVHFIQMDISSTESIKNAYEEIISNHASIDILINNAFYSSGRSPEDMTDEDWNRGINGTLNSVYRCIREVLPHMKKAGGATIINIGSMYGMISPEFTVYNEHPEFLNPPHYGAAKAGVIQLTKYFAAYLTQYNIRVNCISPGPFPSPDVQKESQFIKKLSLKNPLKRIGHPDELQGPLIFLASEASSYVNGHNLVVDGGWTIW